MLTTDAMQIVTVIITNSGYGTDVRSEALLDRYAKWGVSSSTQSGSDT
jgi:hypothetical protein